MKKKFGSTAPTAKQSNEESSTRLASLTRSTSKSIGASSLNATEKDFLARFDEVNALPQLALFQGSRNAKARTTREPEIDNSELATVGGKKVVLRKGAKGTM